MTSADATGEEAHDPELERLLDAWALEVAEQIIAAGGYVPRGIRTSPRVARELERMAHPEPRYCRVCCAELDDDVDAFETGICADCRAREPRY